MVKQLTSEEAIAFSESKQWESMTLRERAEFQLRQEMLCMPFGVFHEAVEKTLGRPVYSHELGLNVEGLIAELEGKRFPPDSDAIIGLLSEKKVIVVDANREVPPPPEKGE